MRPLTGIQSLVHKPAFHIANRQSRTVVMQFLQSAKLYYAVAVIALPLHLLAHGAAYHWYDGLISWLILTTLLYEAKRTFNGPVRNVPIAPLVALQFYLSYGLGVFLTKESPLVWGIYSPRDGAATLALFLALIGAVVCLSFLRLGVYLRTRKQWNVWWWLPAVETVGRTRLLMYAFASLCLWYAANLSPWLLPISVRQILLSVISPYLALSLLLYAWYSGSMNVGKVYVLGHVLIMASVGLLGGSMENLLIPFVALVVAAWLWKGTLLTKTIIAGVFLMLFLSPAKYAYRNLWWASQDEPGKVSVGSRIGYWEESLLQNYGQDSPPSSPLDVVGTRLNGLVQLAQVIDWVPSMIPPRQVSWLREVATYMVPRVLWPGKPLNTERLYHDYALTFGYQTTEGLRGSTTGTTMLVEGYWSMEWAGALWYAAILGFLLGVFFSGGRHEVGGGIAPVISIAFLMSNFQILMPLTIVLSGLPSFIVGTWLAFLLLSAGRRMPGKVSA